MRKSSPQRAFSVPRELSALRTRSGLSLDELASKMGLKRASSIQRYFSETDLRGRYLKLEMARQFADALTGLGDPPVTEAEVMAVDSSMGAHVFALEIRGDSMAERFREGDRVAIDPDIQPMPGDFVAAKEDREDEATFKQYRLRGMDSRGRPIIELRPLNDAWPVITLDAKNPGRIVGTMVEHHSYRRMR